jgi:hypothetical protein
MQALFMNLVPPSSRFFFNSGPEKVLSLSLDVKCDQKTQEKCCLQLWHQSQENYPTKSHNNSANFLCWGIPPIRLKLFFAGFGGFCGFGLWEVEMLWDWVMRVTFV